MQIKILLTATLFSLSSLQSASAASNSMSFFVTSHGGGDGANYGGLKGADKHCQTLADSVGGGNKTWRAYLSTSGKIDFKNPKNNVNAVHARDRIGNGPWYNAKGVLIAQNNKQLHSNNHINKNNSLSEKGMLVNGRGDKPNKHDILTGSRSDGTAFSPFTDTTCKNWTSNSTGSAVVGHHDITGLNNDSWSKSWNFSHQSKGCSEQNLKSTGGAGLLYCFAL